MMTGPIAASDGQKDGRPAVIVMGASSQISRSLLPRLVTTGYTVQATARGARPAYLSDCAHSSWHRIDYAAQTATPPLDKADILIHLAPLPTLPPVFELVR